MVQSNGVWISAIKNDPERGHIRHLVFPLPSAYDRTYYQTVTAYESFRKRQTKIRLKGEQWCHCVHLDDRQISIDTCASVGVDYPGCPKEVCEGLWDFFNRVGWNHKLKVFAVRN